MKKAACVVGVLAVCMMVSSVFAADALTDPGYQITYATGQYNGWQGTWNNRKTAYQGLSGWGTANGGNCAIAGFDRTEINAAIAAAGSNWDAYMLITEPTWKNQTTASTKFVAGAFGVDTIDWASTGMRGPQVDGVNKWSANFNEYNNFEAAVKNGGMSMYAENIEWARTLYTGPTSHNKLRIHIGKDMVNYYLTHETNGFFVSTPQTAGIELYDAAQWDNTGFMMLEVVSVPEPATLALVALGGLALLRRRQG